MRKLLVLAALGLGSPAAAQVDGERSPAALGVAATEAGAYLPFTRAARVDASRGVARTMAGFDSARGEALLEASAEVSLWRRVGLRAGVSSPDAVVGLAPFVGAQLQLLSQRAHGLDAAAGIEYDAHGHEGEPQLELTVALGRRLGGLHTFVNLVYGEELGESQRHGEARAAAFARVAPSLYAGLDGRVAVDLDDGRVEDLTVRDVDLALTAGPTVTWSLGRFALHAQAGVAALRFKHEATRAGAIALAGVGTAF